MADNYRPRNLRLFTYATNKIILHVEDLLDIGKFAFDLWAYQKGQGASGHHTCYLDADDARLVAFRLLHLPQAVGREAVPFKFTDYKGGATAAGEILSRVLNLEWTTETRIPGLRVVAASGPGKLGPTGAVMPAGQLENVTALLPADEAVKLALVLQEQLVAWAAASYYARRANLWQPPE